MWLIDFLFFLNLNVVKIELRVFKYKTSRGAALDGQKKSEYRKNIGFGTRTKIATIKHIEMSTVMIKIVITNIKLQQFATLERADQEIDQL